MHRLAKVSLYGNAAKAVTVNLDATAGAQIGTNLLMPDGSVATTAKLRALFGASTQSSSNLTTTDDLQEGQWNLYFTPRRAQDAVGGILLDSANVTLQYAAGTSITADLTDAGNTATGTLQAITVDAKGRVSGTTDATIMGTDGHIAVANGNASAGRPTIDLDAAMVALIDFLVAVSPSPRVTSDGSYRVTDSGAYRVTA